MFDLIQTTTKDNLILSGLLLPGDTSKPVVINIHGFEGDFFTYTWILDMAKKLHETNHAFLTAQTRGLGTIYEFDTTTPEVCKNISKTSPEH